MARSRYARSVSLVASVAALSLGAGSAAAQQFSCPRTGGDFVFGQEAKVNSLDAHASATVSTRNIAMNIYEQLLARDENFAVVPDLAASVEEATDKLTYTFRLRPGVKFHNGKPLTSADVVASFDRYKRMGVERSMFDVVEKWEAPDAATFVIRMKVAQPTFLENLSSFLIPVVIIPAESVAAPAMQLPVIGTGPWQFVEDVADSHVKLKRFDGYVPNPAANDLNGFAGRKVPCF